jgi:predicted ATPase/DNA-binding CsgD family transcriptional regulator
MSATIEPLGEALTRREEETLALLAQGLSAAEIAARLTLAVSSAKWHIQQIYRKLGVNNRQKAVMRAGALGLLAEPTSETPPRAARARQRGPLAGLRPAPRHNLPLQLTNFIGRAPQIAEVQGRLRHTRLLTLTGPGGTGKTRLALQVAAASLDDFAHGAWLVELAPIADPVQLPQAVAGALGLHDERAQDHAGSEALALMVAHLRDKRLLLVLDNCEHLLLACAQLAEQLLRVAPELRVLATSREALGVAGENLFLVPALSVPDPKHLPAPDVLAHFEAVQLFVERAQSVRSVFTLTAENAPAVARICLHLEGLPLALELAAARAQALTVEQIAAQLAEHDRLHLLTGGGRTAPPRQQTLRGAIDWSYALLSPAEQALLRRLAVFAGGWTLESAEHMQPAPALLDWLTQLVGKSLVLPAQPLGPDARFGMLETIREYAQEKLAAAGETEAARDRHLAYYVALAEEADPKLRGHGQVQWLNRLDRERDNLRLALAWAIKSGQVEVALRLAGALNYYWQVRARPEEGGRWLEAAFHLAANNGPLGPSAWHARALLGAAWLGADPRPSAIEARLEMARDMYAELDDKPGQALALWLVAMRRATEKQHAAAHELFEAALRLWMASEDGWGVGLCLHFMGHLAEDMGNGDNARELYQRSVAILREAGDGWQLMRPLGDLARRAWLEGDAARARAALEENLEAFKALGDSGLIMSLNILASIAAARGDYAKAQATALAIHDLPGNPHNLVNGRVCLGQIAYLQGRLLEAQAHFEAALQSYRELSNGSGMNWLLSWLACVAYRRGDLDHAAALIPEAKVGKLPYEDGATMGMALLVQGDIARAQGQAAAAAEAYGASLQLVVKHGNQPVMADRFDAFAKLAGAAQQPERAARLFGAAAALRARIGIPIPPVEQGDYDAALSSARAQLSPAVFSAAWDAGWALTWMQAAAYALESTITA